jgi:hypothetical protein
MSSRKKNILQESSGEDNQGIGYFLFDVCDMEMSFESSIQVAKLIN